MTREKSTLQPSEARWQKHLPYWNGVRVRGKLLYVRQSGLSFSLLPACLLVCKVPGRTVHLSLLLFEHQPACLLPCLSYCSTACLPAFLTIFLSTYSCLPDRLPVYTYFSILPDRLSVHLLCLLLVCLYFSLLYLLACRLTICLVTFCTCLPARLPAVLVPIPSCLPVGLPTESVF